MKIFVTGASGGLGSALCPVLEKAGHQVLTSDLVSSDPSAYPFDNLDIRDLSSVQKTVSAAKPDLVMHLAAETDVDKCEMEPDHAYRTNTIGTENIALVCQKLDLQMVYISTGGVFEGSKRTPYTEYDAPNPVSVYGRSKLDGEKVVQALVKRHYIFRAGWMIGGGKKDKKFVAKIVRLLQTQNELKAVSDKHGTPTFTYDMSDLIAKVIATGRYGLYHAVNARMTNRYEIAKKIVEILGKKDVKITPVNSSFFPLPAPRAESEAMVNYKLDLLGLNTMPRWEDSLKKYLLTQLEF
jgi:dTDP-4-dehydrorhamnose reductase